MPSTGDTVVYRHHVCTVACVREAYYDGEDYLELHALFEQSLKLYVAVGKAQPPVLRPVMTRARALALVDFMVGAESIPEIAAKPDARVRTFVERQVKDAYESRLKTQSPEDLVSVMKTARERISRRESMGHGAAAVDKKYLELAEGLLFDELSISLGIDRESVGEFVAERVRTANK